jgi:hypothetical protein
MHIPPSKTKSGQAGSTTILQCKRQLLSKNLDFGHWPLGHLATLANSTILQEYALTPLKRENLTMVAQLQFYKKKNSLCPKKLSLATGHFGHFGQFYISTGICTYPPRRENLASEAHIQFYKEKTTSV